MSLGCAVQLSCWICLFFSIVQLFGFFLVFQSAETTNHSYCSKAQVSIGLECAKVIFLSSNVFLICLLALVLKTRYLQNSLLQINKTTRFLRPPSEYQKVVDLCEKAETCLAKISCDDGNEFVAEIMDAFPACNFYRFYTRDFYKCAEKLISKALNISCLDTLFNTTHQPRFDRCQQWLDIQPCVYDAIFQECDLDGNSTFLVTRYAEEAPEFYRSMNCAPMLQNINKDTVDYEMIRLIEV